MASTALLESHFRRSLLKIWWSLCTHMRLTDSWYLTRKRNGPDYWWNASSGLCPEFWLIYSQIWLFKPNIRIAYTTPKQYVLPKSGSIQAAKVLFTVLGPSTVFTDMKACVLIITYPNITLMGLSCWLSLSTQHIEQVSWVPTSRVSFLPHRYLPAARKLAEGEQYDIPGKYANNDWAQCRLAASRVTCYITSQLCYLYLFSACVSYSRAAWFISDVAVI